MIFAAKGDGPGDDLVNISISQFWYNDLGHLTRHEQEVNSGDDYQLDYSRDQLGREKFLEAVLEHPGAVVGLSALLTTTMVNMEKTVQAVKEKAPDTLICVGGAPLTQEFCDKIGASAYSPDPQGIIEWLDAQASN